MPLDEVPTRTSNMEAPQPKRSGFALFYARSRGEIASEKWGVRESGGGVSRESDAFSDKKSALGRGNNCRPKLNLLSGSDFDSGERRGKGQGGASRRRHHLRIRRVDV